MKFGNEIAARLGIARLVLVDDERELRLVVREAHAKRSEQQHFAVPEVGVAGGADWCGRCRDPAMLGRSVLAQHTGRLEVEQRAKAIGCGGAYTGPQLFGTGRFGGSIGRSFGGRRFGRAYDDCGGLFYCVSSDGPWRRRRVQGLLWSQELVYAGHVRNGRCWDTAVFWTIDGPETTAASEWRRL